MATDFLNSPLGRLIAPLSLEERDEFEKVAQAAAENPAAAKSIVANASPNVIRIFEELMTLSKLQFNPSFDESRAEEIPFERDEPKDDSQKSDVVYVWQAAGVVIDGMSVFKIGVTGSRLGVSRIEGVAKKHGFKPINVHLFQTAEPFVIEKFLLQTLALRPSMKGDGSTEFRACTDDQMQSVIDFTKCLCSDLIVIPTLRFGFSENTPQQRSNHAPAIEANPLEQHPSKGSSDEHPDQPHPPR